MQRLSVSNGEIAVKKNQVRLQQYKIRSPSKPILTNYNLLPSRKKFVQHHNRQSNQNLTHYSPSKRIFRHQHIQSRLEYLLSQFKLSKQKSSRTYQYLNESKFKPMANKKPSLTNISNIDLSFSQKKSRILVTSSIPKQIKTHRNQKDKLFQQLKTQRSLIYRPNNKASLYNR